jgi:outer membrane protein assembly factor BamB
MIRYSKRRSTCKFVGALASLREAGFIAAFVVGCHFAAVQADNWDRFRGPNGAGQSDASGIPTEWTEDNYVWKRPLPGVGHSSPVIWGDRLFILSGDTATGEQIASAFDARTGAPLWEQRFSGSSYSMHTFNSYASSTPAVDDKHVYVMWLADGRINLAALTHGGDEVWRRDVGPFSEKHGFGKSPVVVGEMVCVATDSEADSAIVGFERASGDVRWQVPRKPGTTAFATPCLLDPTAENKLLLTVSTASGLTAIAADTGKVAWQGLEEAVPERCVSSPVVANGLAFISSGVGGNGKYLVAARPGNSERGPKEVYRLRESVPNVPTPVVAGDLLFLWHDRGYVSCHDVSTGRRHWRERVGGDYHSSPLRIGERIFCASRGGEMVVLAADRDFRVLARNSLGDPCHATPAVAHDRLYVRTESTLLCVGEPSSNN